jgi:hypothetical protein
MHLIYPLWAMLGALDFFQFDWGGGGADSISTLAIKYEFNHNRGIV